MDTGYYDTATTLQFCQFFCSLKYYTKYKIRIFISSTLTHEHFHLN